MVDNVEVSHPAMRIRNSLPLFSRLSTSPRVIMFICVLLHFPLRFYNIILFFLAFQIARPLSIFFLFIALIA